MSLVQKNVAVVSSVETVVKSVVDLAVVLRTGGALASLLPDLLADLQAIPSLVSDVQQNPFESANSMLLGAVQVAKVLLAPAVVPVVTEG